MGAFRSSDRVSSGNKPAEESFPQSDVAIQRLIKEILGREFRIVKNGLDPEEVLAFLEIFTGSSEAALQRLELAISSKKLVQSIETMVENTRRVSEYIKAEARKEAELEKDKIVQEVRREAEEMVMQAKKSWSAAIEGANSVLSEAQRRAEEMLAQTKKSRGDLIEGINSILLEAVAKARKIEEMAFQHVKAVVEMSTASAQQSIPDYIKSVHRDLSLLYEQYAKELSAALFKGVETAAKPEVQAVTPAAPAPEVPPAGEIEEAFESATEQPASVEIKEEKASPVIETRAEVPKETAPAMFQGKVILIVPQGAGLSWMEQLRQRLNNIPGAYILLDIHTKMGVSIIHLALDQPTPLISVLLEMPEVEKVVEDRQKVEEYSGGLARILGQYGVEAQAMLAIVLKRIIQE